MLNIEAPASLSEASKLVEENLRLKQDIRKALSRELENTAKIRELEALVKHYRGKAKAGYAQRRNANELIRAMWIGAGLVLGTQLLTYGLWELWTLLHGIVRV